MEDFDLRKYLAEGRLLKETFVKLSDEQRKKVKDAAKRGEAPEDVIDSDFGGDDKYLQSVKALMDKLAEGKLLKEDKGINYLKDAFEIYLEGGDDFNKEVGETETVKFENDESLISKEKFKVALQSLPTTVKVDAYNVNFKKVGNDIIGTFKITEGKPLKENIDFPELEDEEDRATRVDKMMSGEYDDEDYKDSKRYTDVRADLDEEIDDEDIVIYDGEEHIIMRKDGNMVYIRPLEDSAILGKRDEIKVPARALAYKSDLDKMYDKYKPKDEMNEVDEKWDKIARDEYGKPWMELSIAQKQEMLSYANRETEKQFQTDYEKRRKGDLDDEYDGMTDYQRGRMDEDMNDPVLMKARAAKIADEKEMARQAALDKKYGSTFMDKLDAEISLKQELQDLKDEREQLMIDMEQEAEPEGGEIADRYGSRLNDIDAKMSVIKSELDDLRMYESLNEGKFYITRNLGRGQGKALVGGYDLKRDKKLPPKVFKSYKDAQKEVKRLERGGSMGGQMTAYIITDKDMNMLEPNGKKMFESVNENTLGDLVKKYGKDLINFVIGIDELTKDEIKDVEYLDDRIQIHLEEPEIRQKYLPEGEEFEYKAPKDTDRDDIKVDPDTEFKIDLKHLIQKHKINEDEIPMYLTNNREFEKAVIVSTSFNDFEKRVYGILGPKYFKLAKIENPGAMKDYYDSIRVTRPSMEESFDLDVTDSGNPETIGDESIERESASPAFETKLTRIYKSIK
jgi:hypothetical protein